MTDSAGATMTAADLREPPGNGLVVDPGVKPYVLGPMSFTPHRAR